jgi:hypothetical protein
VGQADACAFEFAVIVQTLKNAEELALLDQRHEARPGELDGVVHEVDHDLPQQGGVARQDRQLADAPRDQAAVGLPGQGCARLVEEFTSRSPQYR